MSDPPNPNNPDGFVERQIRRVSRNLVILNGSVLGLLVIIVLLLRSYVVGFLHGPQLVDDDYLLNAAEGRGSRLIAYVEIRDHPLIPTGVVEESSQDGKVYSTMSYYLIAVGDNQMLVKATQDAQGHRLIGPLQSISVRSDRLALDAIVTKNPALRNRILPVMVDAAAAFNVFGYVLIGLFTPIVALCAYNIARATIHKGMTSLHPVVRSLARQGDPLELAQAIDAEIAADMVVRMRRAFITRNWVLRPTPFRLVACRLDDIVWAFHAVINWDNVVGLAFRDGRMMGIPMHRNTPELLAHVFQRVPWAEKGWTREIAKKWRTQRVAFLAEVDSRKNAGKAD